jgi:hypothetical protein
MKRPPRAVDRPILTGFGIWRVDFIDLTSLAYTLCAFFWMKAQGASDQLARTVAVNAITIGQVFYLLTAATCLTRRSRSMGSPRQQVPAARHRRGRDPAAALYLCTALAASVRQRGDPAAGLAVALPPRTGVPPGGGGEARHPFVGLLAQRRYRGGSRGVSAETKVPSPARCMCAGQLLHLLPTLVSVGLHG